MKPDEKTTLIFSHSTQFIALIERNDDGDFLIDKVNDALAAARCKPDVHSAEAGLSGMKLENYFREFLHLDENRIADRMTRIRSVFHHSAPVTFREEFESDLFSAMILESTIKPVQVNGRYNHVLWIFHDITPLLNTQRIASESEMRFLSIIQDQTDMISRWKPGGVRTFVNNAYCKTFRIPREEAIGSSFFNLVSDKDFQRFSDNLTLITPENPIESAEFEAILPDGTIRCQEWTNRGLFDSDGTIIEYQSVGRDVTEQKLAQQDLKRSEEKYRILAENLPGVTWSADSNGKVNYISANVEFVIGYKPEDVIDGPLQNWYDQVHADDRQAAYNKFKKILKGETQEYLVEYRFKHREGHWIWLQDGGTMFREMDGMWSVFGVFSDISARKEAEWQLQKAFADVNRLKSRLEMENIYLKEEILLEHNFEEFIFAGDRLRDVLAKIEQVSPVDTSVLITGETGTGKELVARSIHELSKRKKRPMIKLNCGAIPKELVETELFGHEKGAFTGAMEKRLGKFELANGSTIFLDEIGEMPLEMQVKLLRVLQNGEFERIGGNERIKVDVRVVAASNLDLKNEIESGRFRKDLYYRLNVFPIHVPPLRERKEDIPHLTEFFIRRFAGKHGKTITHISEEIVGALKSYQWPGNVRELENMVERGVITSEGGTIRFPELIHEDGKQSSASATLIPRKLVDVERNHIVNILRQCNWKISGEGGAAEILELHPNTLRDRMKKLGIKKPR